MKKSVLLCVSFLFTIAVGIFLFRAIGEKNHQPQLTIIGKVKIADGLGKQSVDVIKALKDDLDIGFFGTEINTSGVPQDIRKMLKAKRSIAPVILFEEVLWYPKAPHYKTLFSIPKNSHLTIAYSMIEGTKVPETWVAVLNHYFDAVAVPDPYLIDVYQSSGVKIPVFELPLLIDLNPFLKAPLKTKSHTPFVFANFSSCIDRKNHIQLLRAFAKTFKNNPDVFLKIEYRYGDEATVLEIEKEIGQLNIQNVLFSKIEHSFKYYLKNFQNVDCYVSLSKSEGFSIQPREAMALGIPVIASDCSAQKTICGSELVKSVKAILPERAYFAGTEPIGQVFNCELDDAAFAMLDVYSNYPSYLEQSQKSREWARNYDIPSLKSRYKTLVNPKKVILGEKNVITSDYLMTNSPELYEKYHRILLKGAPL